MSRQPKTIKLTEDGIKELELLANNPLFPEAAAHARIVLECAKPSTIQEIADKLSINKNIIKKWRDRYETDIVWKECFLIAPAGHRSNLFKIQYLFFCYNRCSRLGPKCFLLN